MRSGRRNPVSGRKGREALEGTAVATGETTASVETGSVDEPMPSTEEIVEGTSGCCGNRSDRGRYLGYRCCCRRCRSCRPCSIITEGIGIDVSIQETMARVGTVSPPLRADGGTGGIGKACSSDDACKATSQPDWVVS